MISEKAGPGDIEALTELRLLYLDEDYGGLPRDKTELIARGLPEYFKKHLGYDLAAFICRDGDMAVGCALLCITEKPPNPTFINGRTGTVLNVYTRHEYRKRGIARGLMKMLIKEAEARGLDFVELKATDAGRRLYSSLGFEEAASRYHNMKLIIDGRNMA